MHTTVRHPYFLLAVLTTLLAAAFTMPLLTDALAQSSKRHGQTHRQDMWNPGWVHRDMWDPGNMHPGMSRRMARHWTFMHQELPKEYRNARNPFPATAEVISEGRALYSEHCASCHGLSGMGDGEASKALNPSPALLAYMIQMPVTVDTFMLWTISEGGAAFDTEMPAFKDTLKEDQIWKIVTFMRIGFPAE